MKCTKEHRYDPWFVALPESQAGAGRHKCAGCAYERGRQDALLASILTVDLRSLPDSQAGSVRHKNPMAAYALGILDGLAIRQKK